MSVVSAARTSAGSTLSIGPAPSTYDAGGFAAVSYNLVGEITDLGDFGKTYKLVTHNPVGSRATIKRKGSYDNGKMSLKMARATSDAGQAAMIAAAGSDSSYSIKVVIQDGTTFYFTAQVMGYMTQIGGVDNITAASADLEIDNDIITV